MSKEWFHQKICSIGAISYFFGTKIDMEKDKFGRKFLHTLNLTSVWIKPNDIKSFEDVSKSLRHSSGGCPPCPPQIMYDEYVVGPVFSRSSPS